MKDSKVSTNFQPFTLDYALASMGILNIRFILLLTGWLAVIALSIGSVLIVGQAVDFSDQFGSTNIAKVFLIQIPMLLGLLLMFWLGFEWGFIPVFISTFVYAFSASMSWPWALLYAFSFTLGLAVYALSYYSFSFDLSLRSLKSVAFYVVVSVFAALACSLGALVWSRFFNLPLLETLTIWKSWWVTLFLISVLLTAPLLYFFTPMFYTYRTRWFGSPEKKEVSLSWIYSTISVIVLVLALFIVSAKLLGSYSVEQEIAGQGISMQVFNSMASLNESFAIVTGISISLLFFMGSGSIYLLGSWNRKLQEEVDAQTVDLRGKELKLQTTLSERNQLLNEIHDRVRSNLTMVLAILEMQLKGSGHKSNEEILKDSHSLIRSLTIVHESMSQTGRTNRVDLRNYAIKLSNRIEQALRKEHKKVVLKVNATEGLMMDMDHAIPFALIINELVMNSCNHGFDEGDEGQVVIEILRDENSIHLKVTDNGKGLPPNFARNQHAGIGMRVVHAFSKQLKTNLDIQTGELTTFSLSVPLEA
ncbi:sensor histidine kinase [Gracilimonas mengyeensis]|uniref:Two-component sensor histidine kinase, contains HisKA and HATPase domains n=1 Tax=Gracilimonas mengyeensis TaxID=1302730 RepID=A0A521C2H9_9BACT|nr:sensor histidine kinase [Gracilimonas mengyeensis]SMO53687.1 Two-component sensor histidine kinase, contains HisKA and HATPase domains [Gracilimonas mengyeensis]